MELTVFKRDGVKKSQTGKIRRESNIPGVIYLSGKSNENIYIQLAEFETHLRKIKPGRLATTIFTLKKGKETIKAIVKDIQYHVTSYRILHLDFMELLEDKLLKVNVPIEYIGTADCVGIKLGGILRKVIRSMRVKCLPKDIPSFFELDVRELKIADSKRLSDIALPKDVTLLSKVSEVCVVIAKR